VAESKFEAPTIPDTDGADQAVPGEPARWMLRAYVSEHAWLSIGVLLLVVSAILIVWARTRPSYDAYGWLVWGHQTLHLSLDLGGAPSWKPMPYLFTVPFALFGRDQMWLWMLTAVTVALAGPVFAGRIAFRLSGGSERRGDPDPMRRYASGTAAIFAGAAVLGIEKYFHYILSVQSDPMLVTFVLAAIDMFLIGRYRWTLLFGLLAALGRPEVWPFLGLFMLWAWFRVPRMRWMLVGSVAVIGFMWFGIPDITNGRPNISGELARLSPHALHHNRIIGTIGRFTELHYLPVWIAALLTAAVALVRRNWAVVALAAGTVGWVIVEIGFSYHGWPAIARYMFEAAAVAAVVAGVGVGWVLVEAARFGGGPLRWTGVLIVAVLVAALIPGAVTRARTEHGDLVHERARTHEIGLLASVTNRLGGARHIVNCGEPVTDVEHVSALAWLYDRNVGAVGGLQQHVEQIYLRLPIPKVLFKPLPQGGWNVLPWHTRPSQAARCAGLHATYTSNGVLIRR
jgi:hypothetical protein